MTEGTPATLAERIARLRTDLLSSDEGRKAIMRLSATGSVQADQDIPNHWGQGWAQGWGQYAEDDEEEGDWGQYTEVDEEEEGDWGQYAEVDEEGDN